MAMFSLFLGGGVGGGVASFAVKGKKHRRTGQAGEGGWSPPPPPSPPQILGNSNFLGSTSQFLKTSACFYYSFEEISIFYFLLPEFGVIIQLHWHETVAA